MNQCEKLSHYTNLIQEKKMNVSDFFKFVINDAFGIEAWLEEQKGNFISVLEGYKKDIKSKPVFSKRQEDIIAFFDDLIRTLKKHKSSNFNDFDNLDTRKRDKLSNVLVILEKERFFRESGIAGFIGKIIK